MNKAAAESKHTQPVHTLRHRNIKAAIWKNETAKGPMYNLTLTRSYREGEQWRESHSFGFDDLPIIAKLMFDAHSHIASLMVQARAQAKKTRKERPAN